jgi:hypothetical protein
LVTPVTSVPTVPVVPVRSVLAVEIAALPMTGVPMNEGVAAII